MGSSLDLVGERFGRLVVLRVWRFKRHRRAEVRCDCGVLKGVYVHNLTNGHVASCGCLRAEMHRLRSQQQKTHGASRTPEHDARAAMIQRCYNARNRNFRFYGARGITVCERWRESFENFLADMGLRPSAKHSIDRIDNDGNYEPGNCRWATRAEQARNRRNTRFVEVGGVRVPAIDVCKQHNVPISVFVWRVRRGWERLRAAMVPTARGRRPTLVASSHNATMPLAGAGGVSG